MSFRNQLDCLSLTSFSSLFLQMLTNFFQLGTKICKLRMKKFFGPRVYFILF